MLLVIAGETSSKKLWSKITRARYGMSVLIYSTGRLGKGVFRIYLKLDEWASSSGDLQYSYAAQHILIPHFSLFLQYWHRSKVRFNITMSRMLSHS